MFNKPSEFQVFNKTPRFKFSVPPPPPPSPEVQVILVKFHVVDANTSSKAFSVAASKLWNNLPQSIKQLSDIDIFKKMIKTHLFRKSYNLYNLGTWLNINFDEHFNNFYLNTRQLLLFCNLICRKYLFVKTTISLICNFLV